jgi:hypothetical protein
MLLHVVGKDEEIGTLVCDSWFPDRVLERLDSLDFLKMNSSGRAGRRLAGIAASKRSCDATWLASCANKHGEWPACICTNNPAAQSKEKLREE